MKIATRFALSLILAALATAARAAEPTDPAELFPPGTLAYAEIHDPAAVGPQLAAAFKGSQLEDSIAFIHQRRDKSKDPRDHYMKEQLAVLGLIASPEMAAEFKRLRGIAVGVTGFNEQGEPEFALAVLTGESSAAGLAARAFLTMSSVRKVGASGDTPVYQFRQPTLIYGQDGRQVLQDEKPHEGTHEATFAYLPGLFVAGTSKAAIGEIVTRFQGKGKGSLAAQQSFKDAAAAYRQPGLFFYGNVPEFLAKSKEAKPKVEAAPEMEHDSLAWFKLLANAKAARYVAGSVRFRDGGLALAIGGSFEPGQKSPLLDLLAGPGVKVELLRHAPQPAAFAFTVSFSESNRSAAVLGFLDALAKANGALGRTPSEAVKELEAKFKVSIAESLLGKTAAATIVFPVKQDLPKGAIALPILVLHGENPGVASAWAELLPKLIGDLSGGDAPQTSSEVIDGLKVITLPAGNLPWKAAVHCVQKGEVFAIGLDRKLVAAAANGATPLPALSVPTDGASIVGSIGAGGLTRLLTEVKPPSGPVVPRGPATPAKPNPGGGFDRFGGEEAPTLPDATNLPDKQKKSEAAAKDDFFKVLDAMPLASVAVKRTGADVRFDLFQPKAHGTGLAPFVNASVGWFDQVLNRSSNPNESYGSRRFNGFR